MSVTRVTHAQCEAGRSACPGRRAVRLVTSASRNVSIACGRFSPIGSGSPDRQVGALDVHPGQEAPTDLLVAVRPARRHGVARRPRPAPRTAARRPGLLLSALLAGG